MFKLTGWKRLMNPKKILLLPVPLYGLMNVVKEKGVGAKTYVVIEPSRLYRKVSVIPKMLHLEIESAMVSKENCGRFYYKGYEFPNPIITNQCVKLHGRDQIDNLNLSIGGNPIVLRPFNSMVEYKDDLITGERYFIVHSPLTWFNARQLQCRLEGKHRGPSFEEKMLELR